MCVCMVNVCMHGECVSHQLVYTTISYNIIVKQFCVIQSIIYVTQSSHERMGSNYHTKKP